MVGIIASVFGLNKQDLLKVMKCCFVNLFNNEFSREDQRDTDRKIEIKG
jgi:hypothetical protein